jgi:hypothetical protein
LLAGNNVAVQPVHVSPKLPQVNAKVTTTNQLKTNQLKTNQYKTNQPGQHVTIDFSKTPKYNVQKLQ